MRMKFLSTAVILFFLLELGACGPTYRKEFSKMLTEKGKVVVLVYTPSRHSSDIHPTIGLDGSIGIGISSNTVPERYGVVFECQHGKFFIERKELYNRLTLGQKVKISYREEYRCKYEEDRLLERVLIDFDFLDAN